MHVIISEFTVIHIKYFKMKFKLLHLQLYRIFRNDKNLAMISEL